MLSILLSDFYILGGSKVALSVYIFKFYRVKIAFNHLI